GFAGDIVFKDAHGNWTWNKTPKQWEELGVIGEIFGLEWGGRWEFKDWPHFQMRPPGVTKDEARQIIQGQGFSIAVADSLSCVALCADLAGKRLF
ncbi:MAG: M15 family metallopeptidase, partial [Alphaproteobacteria bacterium]|nr:M15 family metallopeptidase [Alphaproteobacteria bacterium]